MERTASASTSAYPDAGPNRTVFAGWISEPPYLPRTGRMTPDRYAEGGIVSVGVDEVDRVAATVGARIPRHFYSLQALTRPASTERRIFSWARVRATRRPAWKPLFGSRR